MSILDVLAYQEDCSRRLKNLYFRCVVLANASTKVVEVEGRFYGPCEHCGEIAELSYEKFEDGQGLDHEVYICENCLTRIWGRMQQRMDDDNARERRER